ncbi:MAG TPA: hypothetical protein VEF04_21130 [Blastocatellia bacterium]|nr:hypothetical protein [Blastocatellia bacterium]
MKNAALNLVLLFVVIPASLLTSQKQEYKIKLIDEATKKPVAQKKVRIYSDNGIRCIKAPCPTNGKEWKGESDANGVIIIKEEFVQNSMTLTAEGYEDGTTIDHEKLRAARGVYTLVLRADRKLE